MTSLGVEEVRAVPMGSSPTGTVIENPGLAWGFLLSRIAHGDDLVQRRAAWPGARGGERLPTEGAAVDAYVLQRSRMGRTRSVLEGGASGASNVT